MNSVTGAPIELQYNLTLSTDDDRSSNTLAYAAAAGGGNTVNLDGMDDSVNIAGNPDGIVAGVTISGFRNTDSLITGAINSIDKVSFTQIVGGSNGYGSLGFYSTKYYYGTIELIGDYTNSEFSVLPGGIVTYSGPCYRSGTLICTDHGETPIETLRTGDLVALAGGGTAPVKWLGHQHVDCAHHPKPVDVWPVRVAAGAFGSAQPRRDLWLSPDHAIHAAGVLIPIRYLVNGATITQEPVESVTYWHLELPAHDVILAEGLPAESYLDTGNRGAFTNGGAATHLHPDFARRIWAEKSCAPLVLDGPRLAAVKFELLTRATELGHALTDAPDLRVVADGRELAAESDGQRWHVRLPASTENIRLISRVWKPANTRPNEDDTRLLGVAVSRLWLDRREVSLESPGLHSGWHPPEPSWRWTDGDAGVAVAGARELAFEVAMTGTYWQAEKPRASVAA